MLKPAQRERLWCEGKDAKWHGVGPFDLEKMVNL